MVDHLNDRVHPDYWVRRLVRPYNTSMSHEYRDAVMRLFRGSVQGSFGFSSALMP
jgi:hypothetical protein